MTREQAIKEYVIPALKHTWNEKINKEVLEALEQEPTNKNDLAHERYQDLIEYFGDEKVAKTILESRKEFKAWLERLRWHVKRADELDRELEQIKGTTKNDLGVDCISRAQTQTEIEMNASRYTIAKERGGMGQVEWSDQLIKVSDAVDIIRNLPSVTPQEPKCKDCKWWKDSDGAYRRGIGAESKCPMNRIEVYEGNGYCFLFEPQESEDKE